MRASAVILCFDAHRWAQPGFAAPFCLVKLRRQAAEQRRSLRSCALHSPRCLRPATLPVSALPLQMCEARTGMQHRVIATASTPYLWLSATRIVIISTPYCEFFVPFICDYCRRRARRQWRAAMAQIHQLHRHRRPPLLHWGSGRKRPLRQSAQRENERIHVHALCSNVHFILKPSFRDCAVRPSPRCWLCADCTFRTLAHSDYCPAHVEAAFLHQLRWVQMQCSRWR
jgi:hypothetical protein